ncbi:MAG: DNA helicase RecQ [Candidatus Scalindua sp.]|nr:DNA helicase RecQ [Candidatus Scalindua sp.]
MYDTLKSVFGFQSFRPNQETIIKNILQKKDVFAVISTGGGKSLCYQLPAKIMAGTTVVISPLISLMKDQVDAALENGIAAAFINSSLSRQEMSAVNQKLHNRALELLYIAPERFAMPNFIEELKTIPLSLFAVDEAHCISEWGHDFRPDYLSLSNVTRLFPDVPVAAFTATATPKVQDDIIDKIGLRSPFIVRASFNRHNLFYQVKRKREVGAQILEFLKEYKDDPGIIYRTTRDSVVKLSEFLIDNGIKALPYHAGLEVDVRKENQEAFSKDKVNVIVATVAFGMGIDKSNVRFVIHADLPKNIEGYYQETGRAGRDGELASCLLFFASQDIPKIRYFIDQIPEDEERSTAMYKLNQMVAYASHYVCRRRQLLSYFGEEYTAENCGTCDVCVDMVEKVDATTDAQIVMSAILRTDQRFGINHIVDIVIGANTSRIRELNHDGIKTYGAGKHKDKNHWRFIVDELLAQEVIVQDGGQYPVLNLTAKGYNILYGRETISALKREEVKKRKKTLKGLQLESYDEVLFERLRLVRMKFAEEQQVPPYIIFSDKALHEMCAFYPVTPADMKKINGVGDVKLERYGNEFISAVKRYLNENPGISVPDTQSLYQSADKPQRRTMGGTVETTGKLFKQGFSIHEIAKSRNLTAATISAHIETLIRDGCEIEIDRLIDAAKRKEIEKLFQELKTWNTGPVVEHSRGRVSYDEAKFVRAYVLRKSVQ